MSLTDFPWECSLCGRTDKSVVIPTFPQTEKRSRFPCPHQISCLPKFPTTRHLQSMSKTDQLVVVLATATAFLIPALPNHHVNPTMEHRSPGGAAIDRQYYKLHNLCMQPLAMTSNAVAVTVTTPGAVAVPPRSSGNRKGLSGSSG